MFQHLYFSAKIWRKYIHRKLRWLAGHVNFRCIYFRLKMVVLQKHAEDNLNKIVNNYWNRVALDRNPWTWHKQCWRKKSDIPTSCNWFTVIQFRWNLLPPSSEFTMLTDPNKRLPVSLGRCNFLVAYYLYNSRLLAVHISTWRRQQQVSL
jgi:hypothetical protein